MHVGDKQIFICCLWGISWPPDPWHTLAICVFDALLAQLVCLVTAMDSLLWPLRCVICEVALCSSSFSALQRPISLDIKMFNPICTAHSNCFFVNIYLLLSRPNSRDGCSCIPPKVCLRPQGPDCLSRWPASGGNLERLTNFVIFQTFSFCKDMWNQWICWSSPRSDKHMSGQWSMWSPHVTEDPLVRLQHWTRPTNPTKKWRSLNTSISFQTCDGHWDQH